MTAMAWAHGAAVSWALGLGVIVLALGRATFARGDAAPLFLSFWLGLLASSLVRYVLQIVDLTDRSSVLWVDHALLASILLAAVLHWRRAAPCPVSAAPPARARDDLLAGALAVVVLILALRTTVAKAGVAPFGMWDAISMWNLKAQALAAGGHRWASLLDATDWPDYPVLLPLNVARLWAYAAQRTPEVPRWTAELQLVALGGMLVGALRRDRGPWIALTGLAVLLAALGLRILAAAQYADLPLGGMELATLICLWRSWRGDQNAVAYAALGGAFAAGGLWTKNDGAPFFLGACAAVGLGALSPRIGRDGRAIRRLIAWGLGVLPVLAVVLHFKSRVHLDTWLLSGRSLGEVVEGIVQLDRWKAIVWAYQTNGPQFVTPATLVLWALLVIAMPCTSPGFWPRWSALAGVVLLQATVYTLVYLVSPYDAVWHALTSSDRLVLHMWPAVVWLGFLLVEETPRPSPPTTP